MSSIANSQENLFDHVSWSLSQKKLLEDMNEIRLSKRYSDITFLVNGKHFPAHTAILGTRCPELLSKVESMSTSPLPLKSEKKNGKRISVDGNSRVIEFKGFDEELMAELLRYLYTGKVEGMKFMSKRLLEAAVEYKLGELRDLCEKSLQESLNANNCIDLLIFAEQNKSCYSLKQKTLNFINDNKKDVVDSPMINKLTNSYPQLLEEVFRFVVINEIGSIGSVHSNVVN